MVSKPTFSMFQSDPAEWYLELIDRNNETLGWIDENGTLQGSLAGGSGTGSTAIDVKSAPYNAKGNGTTTVGVTTVSSSKTLIVANPFFTSSMIGQALLVQGAGATGLDLWTTITAFTSSTQVTMADAASTTLTSSFFNSVYVGGTDDTAAIQAALNAAGTASPGPLGVYIPAGVYIISASLTLPTPLPPASIVGDGPTATILLRSQAFQASSDPLLNFDAGENSCDVRGMGFQGASLATGASPVAGQEIVLNDFGTCQFNQISCFNTKFVNGLKLRMTNGTILAPFDVSQSEVHLDNCQITAGQAASYNIIADGLGGAMINCVTLGYLDASTPRTDAGFQYTGLADTIPITLFNCVAGGNPGTETGFSITGYNGLPVTLINCVAENCTTAGFVTSGAVRMISCFGTGNTLDLSDSGPNVLTDDCYFQTIQSPKYHIGLSTALSPVDLFTLAGGNVGLFHVFYYLECTTAGTGGNIVPNFAWTDDNGAQTANGTSLPANAKGYVSGVLIVRVGANSSITFGTTFSSVTGSPIYNAFLGVIKGS